MTSLMIKVVKSTWNTIYDIDESNCKSILISSKYPSVFNRAVKLIVY